MAGRVLWRHRPGVATLGVVSRFTVGRLSIVWSHKDAAPRLAATPTQGGASPEGNDEERGAA